MRGFPEKPEFKTPLEYPCKWKDTATGLIIPKRQEENLIWREKVLREAERDPILQKDLKAACSKSPFVFFNLFAFTYHQFEVDPVTHENVPAEVADHPFITWPCQDIVISKITA